MFNSFKGLLSKATESAKASVDSITAATGFDTLSTKGKSLGSKIGETVKPFQDPISSKIKQVDLEKPKKVLATLKDETAKLGNEILTPQATFVLSPKYYSENVEIDAGLELLHKFETETLVLRTCSKNLAAKADATDRKIAPLYQRVVAEHEAWTKFRKELNVLPDMTNNIAKIQGELETMCTRIDLLESALTEQTERVAAMQLGSFTQHQLNLTELYKRKKELSVEEAEHELRTAAFKREEQRLELEKIKVTERMTEQMIKAKEKERSDKSKNRSFCLQEKENKQECENSSIWHFKLKCLISKLQKQRRINGRRKSPDVLKRKHWNKL